MKRKFVMTTTLTIVIAFLLTPFVMKVNSQPPPIPMTLDGYVFIQITGQNITAPEGLYVYAKVNTTVIANATTEAEGEYTLSVTGPEEGTLIGIWVQDINVTTVTLQYYEVLDLNLTVTDLTPPTIEPLWPTPGAVVPAPPLWINVSLTDNLAVNQSTIIMTLNETSLTPTYDPVTGLLTHQATTLDLGFYIVNVTATDLAGNTATKTWNFTAVAPTPPTITIISPTTQNPVYTQAGQTITINFTYTTENPKNVTVKVYNSTTTIGKANITDLERGTSIEKSTNITLNTSASDGKYDIEATIYTLGDLNVTDIETEAAIIDNTPPIVEITYPTEGAYLSVSTIWINGTVTELNLGQLEPAINDTRFELFWKLTTKEFAFKNKTAISDGSLSVMVSFIDLAENTGSGAVSFTLDTTPPTITVVLQNPPADNVLPTDTVKVNATITDDISGVKQVILNYTAGDAWIGVNMTKLEGDIYNGIIPLFPYCTNVTYKIEAEDQAGNIISTEELDYHYEYHVVPEFHSILAVLLLLAITTTIAMMTKAKHENTKVFPLK